ncbi:MAG TPA: type II toxin-antitoxin system antitoxin SocA domain-containing protein [Chitinophagaceae bacterium]|nr:type II toxin-antitoxin system antitoxin SocA domain-containing protein [Chitinophagaceae bacterium]
MVNPLAIANYFVGKSLDTGEELTVLKLVKLVYISHGWYLAWKNEDLLSHAVEAWQYGPVVPVVYHRFKEFGDSQIKEFADDVRTLSFYVPRIEDAEIAGFLDNIWDEYKQYNGLQLSTLTHLKGTPWDIVYNDPKNKDKRGVIIPNNLIKEHYLQKLNANRLSKQSA